jgi:hypothetical protein
MTDLKLISINLITMKKEFWIVSIIFSLLISCENEDNSLKTPSKFSFNGKEYSLDKGYIHHELGTQFYVYLLASSIEFIPSGDDGAYILKGGGMGIELCLDSIMPTEISTATYKWPTHTTPNSEMICAAFMIVSDNSPLATHKGMEYGIGTVAVSKIGEEFTIEFDLNLDPSWGGGRVSGQYIGTLLSY